MDDTLRLDAHDHRRLGKALDLFVFSDLVGSGLPLLTPKGVILREQLLGYSEELRRERGFEKVWTPHITKDELYKRSGHWDKFGAELFLVKSQETKDQLVLKPMNCPHHIQIFASRPRSYRELPVKYMESATVYRDEKSGELQGLARVRSINMDDSHVFCRPEQIAGIIEELIEAAKQLYKTFGMDLTFRLSFRDESEAYLGSKELWSKAETILKEEAKKSGIEYFEGKGEAAFYGPKIDFMATDVLKRTWQVATVQLDFVMPERFELAYTDEHGKEERPVMIHCALLGSIERFLAVYIEHTGGNFPVWLAPEQLRILTLNNDESILRMAQNVVKSANALGVRASVDNSNESVGKKIREAETAHIPYVAVIGPKETESGNLSVRVRTGLADADGIKADKLLDRIAHEVKVRS